jgi:hypothetical protein
VEAAVSGLQELVKDFLRRPNEGATHWLVEGERVRIAIFRNGPSKGLTTTPDPLGVGFHVPSTQEAVTRNGSQWTYREER